MREIKLPRAWDKIDEEMLFAEWEENYVGGGNKKIGLYVYRSKKYPEAHSSLDWIMRHPESFDLEQFLALGKNKAEIYEGSIIEMPYVWYESNGDGTSEILEEGVYVGEVVMWPSCGMRIKDPVRHTVDGEKIRHKTHVGVSAYTSTVIGDKHQNPELLKKG
jgi:hypothetical protein